MVLISPMLQVKMGVTPYGRTHEEWEELYESLDYTVENVAENYETRVYPAKSWVCTNMTVDTAQDPLAGLEDWDFKEIMQSKRYKTRVPSSLMFWPLFNYINGDNEGEVKIKMTRTVTTSHALIKRDVVWGDLELQEMCFYLPSKFQAERTEQVPKPLDQKVYTVNKPEFRVFVRQFPGWAFTAAVWQANRDILSNELTQAKERFDDELYFTTQKSHPWVPAHRRVNEVWFPTLEEEPEKQED